MNGPISKFIVFLAMACFAAGANYEAFTDFVSVKDDLWLNSHGTLAQNPSIDVRHHIHSLPELCASYFTRQGKQYSNCIMLWFPLVLIDENSPQIVHYNPASPEHFGTSWGRQILFSRICTSLVFVLLACCIDLAILTYMLQKFAGKEPSPPASQPAQSAAASAAASKANPYREAPSAMATNPSSPLRKKSPAKDGAVKTFLFKALGYTVLFLVFGPMVVALPYGVYIQFASLKDDIWLNWQGALAPRSHVYYYHQGSKYRSETFCLTYDTQRGQELDKCVDFAISIIGIDTAQPMIVRYNPNSPEHISTSWARQKLISRIPLFFFTCFLTVGIELGVTYEIIKKFMGWDAPGAGLRPDALALSAALDKIISGLQSQSGANAAYGQAIAAELTPLVAQYNRALEGTSREEASRALDEVVASMDDFKRNRKKKRIHLGFRHWMDMRKYESLTDIFRETKYRNDSL